MNKNFLSNILFLLILTYGCNQIGNGPAKTPEELRLELKILEQANPSEYLTAEATINDSMVKTREEGWFNDAEFRKNGSVIRGRIKNAASLAKYKDIIVTVSYYSATNTVIKSEDHIFYEFYEPNSSKPFVLHVHAPTAMKKFGLQVKYATATE